MAYLRYRRKTRRTYAKSGRTPRSRSARPSRYIGRTRRYTKRRAMSKRRVLNVTSRKKKDTMLAMSNTTVTGTPQPVTVAPASVNANTGGTFLWCATARDLTPGAGDLARIAQDATRTAHLCYMRGLAENLRIQTNSSLAWFHRRICFTYKGTVPFRTRPSADTGTAVQYIETSNGMQRLWFNSTINQTPNYLNDINGVIFKGAQGIDWNDTMTARVDSARIGVKYDKVRLIKSDNENGAIRVQKHWHPMNKNLLYDEDETGASTDVSYWSAQSKVGMGDYYIIDFFQGAFGGGTGDIIRIDSTSTLYWHEK